VASDAHSGLRSRLPRHRQGRRPEFPEVFERLVAIAGEDVAWQLLSVNPGALVAACPEALEGPRPGALSAGPRRTDLSSPLRPRRRVRQGRTPLGRWTSLAVVTPRQTFP
jgi:hypothetical protein